MLVAQLCLILCNPMGCSLPGSFVHGIFQARILEWVAIPFSRGSFWPRDQTRVSCTAGRFYDASHQGNQLLKVYCLNEQQNFCMPWSEESWPLFQSLLSPSILFPQDAFDFPLSKGIFQVWYLLAALQERVMVTFQLTLDPCSSLNVSSCLSRRNYILFALDRCPLLAEEWSVSQSAFPNQVAKKKKSSFFPSF